MDRQSAINTLISKKQAHLESKKATIDSTLERLMSDVEYSSLEKQRRELNLELYKCSNGEIIEVLEEKLNNIKNEQRNLRLLKGVPDDALILHYDCEKCKDTGVFRGNVCSCIMEELPYLLADKSSNDDSGYSLDCDVEKIFAGTKQQDKMRKIYAFYREYCAKFPNVKVPNSIILGKSGAGKTALMKAFKNELVNNNVYALFFDSFSMHNIFLKYHTAPISEKADIFAPLTSAQVLIIDDLGTEPMFKNVTLEYLLMLIDSRNNAGLATHFTTNLTTSELINRYGERIYSRLLDNRLTTVINLFNADNLRLKK